MVCDFPDAFGDNPILFRDTAHVRPKVSSDFWTQHRGALFGAKDTMDVEARKSVRHMARGYAKPGYIITYNTSVLLLAPNDPNFPA